jgi:cysteine desulfurase
MEKYLSRDFYNPSSIYDEGRVVRQALEEARTQVARIVHAGTKDVIFTSGGTESDNLAILGALEEVMKTIPRPHIIVAEHEHSAIIEAARAAERRGAELSIVPVEEIVAQMRDNTALISLSLVNGETGEINPVARIGRAVRASRKARASLPAGRQNAYPLLHVDASQAALTQHINVDTLQADLLTLDAGKIYGPKGAGALIVRPWAHLVPQMVGGGQERGLRSGTENLPGIAGFAEALSLADAQREVLAGQMKELRELFVLHLRDELPEAIVNGGESAAPNIVSVTIPGKLHEYLAVALAEKGVLVSAGSSCRSRKDGGEQEALRFSFGRATSARDIERAVRALGEVLI